MWISLTLLGKNMINSQNSGSDFSEGFVRFLRGLSFCAELHEWPFGEVADTALHLHIIRHFCVFMSQCATPN